MRIALIADSHLSRRAPECVANWYAASRAIERLRPDLTIHLGDITLDGQSHPEELELVSVLVRRWPTRMLCVPGNHDVGDGSGERPLKPGRLEAYVRLFGTDHWLVRADGWELRGVNAQRLGAGGLAEDELHRWLVEPLTTAPAAANFRALFLHQPLRRVIASDVRGPGCHVPQPATDRLWKTLDSRPPALVVSGHVHQYLDVTVDGVRHLWMPSTGFVLPETMQSSLGRKFVGIALLELAPDRRVRLDAWCPDGMVRYQWPELGAFSEHSRETCSPR